MAQEAKYVTVTDSNFQEEVLNSDVPVLVDFWSVWCGPCRVIAPVVEQLAEQFDGRAKVAKVDVDHSPQTAMNFGIRSIPTLLFFKDGQVVDQMVGGSPSMKRALSSKLESLVGQPA